MKAVIAVVALFLSYPVMAQESKEVVRVEVPNKYSSGDTSDLTRSQLNENFEFIHRNSVPVGSIISSVLEPIVFATLAGDDGRFDPTTSKWYPANGDKVNGSIYARATGGKDVPNLSGMFLRGLNYSFSRDKQRKDGHEDPDGKERSPGSIQPDTVAKHKHHIAGYLGLLGGIGGESGATPLRNDGVDPASTTDNLEAGKETRPRNIAVFYYIKIN